MSKALMAFINSPEERLIVNARISLYHFYSLVLNRIITTRAIKKHYHLFGVFLRIHLYCYKPLFLGVAVSGLFSKSIMFTL